MVRPEPVFGNVAVPPGMSASYASLNAALFGTIACAPTSMSWEIPVLVEQCTLPNVIC
jgi:hypothetical protein